MFTGEYCIRYIQYNIVYTLAVHVINLNWCTMHIVQYTMSDVCMLYIHHTLAELESWLKNSARTPIYQCELL